MLVRLVRCVCRRPHVLWPRPLREQIMQYGARFLFWWFATTDPALSQRAFKLYKTTQRSRKAFRMLKVNP